jgi:predicted DNA-binding protein with PD1-like motif
MRSKLLDQSNGLKIFATILQAGDEVKDALIRFARAEHVTAASFTAIGAFERATVGWFDIERKEYRPISVDELPYARRGAATSCTHRSWPF